MNSRKKTYEKVFGAFARHYKLVPLEVFGKDPYKTLFSTILSSRTKDETTLKASQRLFKRAPGVFALSKLSQREIAGLIYPVGFYKTKAKHLKEASKALVEKFEGKIPKEKAKLTSLSGVGGKTANLVLNRAFCIPAIAVDTHVHKISNILGWVKTKTPEQTERKLVKILPKKYWSRTNRLFVSIGRQYTTRKRLEEFLRKNKLLK